MLRVQTDDAGEMDDFRLDQLTRPASARSERRLVPGLKRLGGCATGLPRQRSDVGRCSGPSARASITSARARTCHCLNAAVPESGRPADNNDRAVQLAANRQQAPLIEVVGVFGGQGTVFRDLLQCTIDVSSLLASDRQRRNARRSLQRGRIDEIPYPLQIGMAIRESRRAILGSGRRRRKDRERGGASER